jgi:hypothetical protein
MAQNHSAWSTFATPFSLKYQFHCFLLGPFQGDQNERILAFWVVFKIFFVADAFISDFNTQTMHNKTFYTQLHCYVFGKTLYPGGIRTQVFSFLRRMRCPLRHAARALMVGLFTLGSFLKITKMAHIFGASFPR